MVMRRRSLGRRSRKGSDETSDPSLLPAIESSPKKEDSASLLKVQPERGTVIHSASCFSFRDHVYVEVHIVEFSVAKVIEVIVFHPTLYVEAPRFYLRIVDLWFFIELEQNPLLEERDWNRKSIVHLWHTRVFIRFQRKRVVDFVMKHLRLSNSDTVFAASLQSDVVEELAERVRVRPPACIEPHRVVREKRLSASSYEVRLEHLRHEAVICALLRSAEKSRAARELRQREDEIAESKRAALERLCLLSVSAFLGAPRSRHDYSRHSLAAQRWFEAYERVRFHCQTSRFRFEQGLGHLPPLNGDRQDRPREELENDVIERRRLRLESRLRFKDQEDGVTVNTHTHFE